jgi:hypothetical protein
MQINSQTNYAQKLEHIKVLLSYKVFRCRRTSCPFERPATFCESTKCEFYHGDDDQRRFPFAESMVYFQRNDRLLKKFQEIANYGLDHFFAETAGVNEDGSQRKIRLAYLKTMRSVPDKEKGCLNLEEMCFHPMNFKSRPCVESENCKSRFCPRYHSSEEALEFKKLRKIFEDIDPIEKTETCDKVRTILLQKLIDVPPASDIPIVKADVQLSIPADGKKEENCLNTETIEPMIDEQQKTQQHDRPEQCQPSDKIHWRQLDAFGNYELETDTKTGEAGDKDMQSPSKINGQSAPPKHKAV